MGIRLNARLILGVIMTALLISMGQPRSLQAQTNNSPPSLVGRIDSVDIAQPDATAFAIWDANENQRHEVWFRIIGGDALYQQRLRVYEEDALPRATNVLPPRSQLAHEIEGNRSSDWYFMGFKSGFHTYYFDGDNRPNSFFSWDNAKAVRAQKTIFSNGDLYEISFEDLNTLDDYNDLEIEVVLVHN